MYHHPLRWNPPRGPRANRYSGRTDYPSNRPGVTLPPHDLKNSLDSKFPPRMSTNSIDSWDPTFAEPRRIPSSVGSDRYEGTGYPTSTASKALDPTSNEFIPSGGVSVKLQTFTTSSSSRTQTSLAFVFDSPSASQRVAPGGAQAAANPVEYYDPQKQNEFDGSLTEDRYRDTRVDQPRSLAVRIEAIGRYPLPPFTPLKLPQYTDPVIETPTPTNRQRLTSSMRGWENDNISGLKRDNTSSGQNPSRSQQNQHSMHGSHSNIHISGRGMPTHVQTITSPSQYSDIYAHTCMLPRDDLRMDGSAQLIFQPSNHRTVVANQDGRSMLTSDVLTSTTHHLQPRLDKSIHPNIKLSLQVAEGHVRGLSPRASEIGSHLSTHDDEVVAAARQISGPPSPGSEPHHLQTRFYSEPRARPLSPSTTATTSSIHLLRHKPSITSLVELACKSRLGIDNGQQREDDEQTPSAPRYKMSERPPPPSQQGPPPRMMSLTSPTRANTDRGMPSTPTHNPLINRGMGQSTRGMANSTRGISSDGTYNNNPGQGGSASSNNLAYGNNSGTSSGATASNSCVYGRGNYSGPTNNAGYGTLSGGAPSNYGRGNAPANNTTYGSGTNSGTSSGTQVPNNFGRGVNMDNNTDNTRSFAGVNPPASMATSRPSGSGGRMGQYNYDETALQAISDNTSIDVSEFSRLSIVENGRPNVDPFGPTQSAATPQSGALLTPADGMSRELRALTEGGRVKPNAAVALNVTFLPFKEFCLTARQFNYGVIVISNIPYNLTRSEVQAFLGRNAKIVPEAENESIHIIMERVTSKTLDCYVEFTSVSEAIAAVNRFESLKMSGRSGRLGQRHVEVELSSQEELMKQLFPKAKNVQWTGSRPNIIPRDYNDKYNSGFQGFITSEELVMLVKHVESPQRSPFSKECPQRPFECLISTLSKYPWYMTKHITIQDRNRLFRATVTLLKTLIDRVQREYDPVHLNGMLVKRVIIAALACPGFTPNMKDDIVYYSGIDGRKAHELGHAPHAEGWRALWTIGPKKDAPYDLVMWYVKLISEWTMKNCKKPTLAEQAALGRSEYGPSTMFGRLEEFLDSSDPTFSSFTLAQVAEKEWAVLEKIIRESLPTASESE